MFIVWGHKVRRKVKGFCADFCPSCREIRACRVTDFYRVPHVYWIPLGSGSHEGTERECTSCRTPMPHDPTVPLQRKATDMEAMLADVPPVTQASWLETIREDERIAANPEQLTPIQRIERMVNTFVGLEQAVASELGGDVRVTWRGIKWLLVWFATLITLAFSGETIGKWGIVKRLCEKTDLDGFGLAAVAMVGLGVLIILYLVLTRVPHYFASEVYPRLVPRLYPLKPKPEELKNVRKALKGSGYKVAKFRVPALIKALQAYAISKSK
jgi:hypothetical protein